MKPALKEKLGSLVAEPVAFGAPLAPLTTFGLGGPAAALVQVGTASELRAVMDLARREGLPLFVLGAGSNVLFKDGGFSGVVLRLGPSFARLETRKEGEKVLLEVGAAAPLARLVERCLAEGLSGLEFLAGIPGWVGGGLAMNAGAFGGQIADALLFLEILDPSGRALRIPRDQIRAGYRRIDLEPGAVILGACFELAPALPEQVRGRVKECLERRRRAQPAGVRSAGSVFKNPGLGPAGALIEKAGLKGANQGGAWVSEVHANFIVHRGGARARDVLTLIERVQAAVQERFGVWLEPEIKIVGENGAPGEE
jgi:UDP-N-acetylmuramate dehydrogenase